MGIEASHPHMLRGLVRTVYVNTNDVRSSWLLASSHLDGCDTVMQT